MEKRANTKTTIRSGNFSKRKTMRKCAHDVYFPEDIEGTENPYCSGCNSSHPDIKLRGLADEQEADEIKITKCPLCFSETFIYRDEDDFTCENCGYSQDNII